MEKQKLKILLIIIIILDFINNSNGQKRNTELLNVGSIFSLPYDLSNTLRAPLGGPLSIALTAGLALIMCFGLVVSPVYYFLGSPNRKYQPIYPADKDSFKKNNKRTGSGRSFNFDSENSLDFLENAFFFIPEEDEICKKIMVCHAHGFLQILPVDWVNYYRLLGTLFSMDEKYKEAIKIGLEDQGNCVKIFRGCSKNVDEIANNTKNYILQFIQKLFLPSF